MENSVLCVPVVCFEMGMITCFYVDENLTEESVNRKENCSGREERLVGTCLQQGAGDGVLCPGWGAWEGRVHSWTATGVEVLWVGSLHCLPFSVKLGVGHLQRARHIGRERLKYDSGDLKSK